MNTGEAREVRVVKALQLDDQRCDLWANGGGGIRTLGRLATSPVFKTGAIGRSATPPVL